MKIVTFGHVNNQLLLGQQSDNAIYTSTKLVIQHAQNVGYFLAATAEFFTLYCKPSVDYEIENACTLVYEHR